jgi:hypothetical protein
MADKDYNIKISADTSQAQTAVNTLAGDVNNLGKTTQSTEKAFQNNANAIAKSYEKAENAIKTLEGIAKVATGTIAVGAGALGMLGADSEKLGEIEKKVQSSIALVLGVRELAEGALILVQRLRAKAEQAATLAAQQNTIATTQNTVATDANVVATTAVTVATEGQAVATVEATAAQEGLNVAVAANPYVKAAVIIATIIATLYALKDTIGVVGDAFGFVGKQITKFLDLIGLSETADQKAMKASELLADQLKREGDVLKAQGASAKAQYDNRIAQADATIKKYKEDTKEYLDAVAAKKVIEEEYTKSVKDETDKRNAERKKEVDEAVKLAKELAFQNNKYGKNEFDQRIADAIKLRDEQYAILDKGNKARTEATRLYNNTIATINKDAQAALIESEKSFQEAIAVTEVQQYELRLKTVSQFFAQQQVELIKNFNASKKTTEDKILFENNSAQLILAKQQTLNQLQLQRQQEYQKTKNDIDKIYIQSSIEADSNTFDVKQFQQKAYFQIQLEDTKAYYANAKKLIENQRDIDLIGIKEGSDEALKINEKYGSDLKQLNLSLNGTLENQNEAFRKKQIEEERAYRAYLRDFAVDQSLSLIDTLRNINELTTTYTEEEAIKQFNVSKQLSIAEAILSTYSAASKAYESQIGIPILGPILAPIAAGVAVLAGVARVAQISATSYQSKNINSSTPRGATPVSSGGGGRGAPGLPSTTGAGNSVGGYGFPQIIGNQGQTTLGPNDGSNSTLLKTYVLAGDVTNAQAANAALNQKRQF